MVSWLDRWLKRYDYPNTRRFIRLPASWPVQFHKSDSPQSKELADTKDVSAGGASIFFREMIPVGTQLNVEFQIPDIDKKVPAKAQVIRCQALRGGGFELGLVFKQMDPQDRKTLDDTIKDQVPPRQRKAHHKNWSRTIPALLLFLIAAPALAAYDPSPPIKIDVKELNRRAPEESESLSEFFRARTTLGLGFDEVFNNNVFLQDNNNQEDYISYLEGQVLFIDPRGNLLYGTDYEANAFRYHVLDQNAIDHEWRIFADLDTGGRSRWQANYKMDVKNSLLLGPESVDILRRNTKFVTGVTHNFNAKMLYALNETNALVPQLDYTLFDDQAKEDSDSDRRTFKAILDLDHDLTPLWVAFAGYEHRIVSLPGNELKNSDVNALRLGTRYEATELLNLFSLLRFEHREWDTGQGSNSMSFEGRVNYQLGARTQLLAGYTDENIPSFASSRLQFRSRRPYLGANYELSPLTKVNFLIDYEKQSFQSGDTLAGETAVNSESRRWGFKTGLFWQFRRKSHITLDYFFSRGRSGDFTNHIIAFGIETEL